MWKTIWKDPVWSSVIATVILATGGMAGMYFLNLWPTIGSYATDLAKSAVGPSEVPNWLFWIAVALAMPTVLFLLALLRNAFRSTTNSVTNNWHSYTEDNFFGLHWRWEYYSGGNIGGVHSFCPHCDFQVFPHQASAYSSLNCIAFHCDGCGQDLGTFNENYTSLESKVERFIQQKLRNNSWNTQSGS